MTKVYQRKCDHCGESYTGYGKHFCGSTCFYQNRFPNPQRPTQKQHCKNCGKYYEGKNRQFCSLDCYKGFRTGRFWQKVEIKSLVDCWTWLGASRGGYGLVWGEGKTHKTAHRVAWELVYGKIPVGMFVLHKCDNPACVNPSHLFTGSPQDNMDDMVAKGRSRRGEGHPQAILTEVQIRKMRKQRHAGVSLKELAVRFGTSYGNICNVVYKKSWRHLL